MGRKKSFVMYTKIGEVVDKLSDADAGRLLKEVLAYVEDGTVPEVQGAAEIVFYSMKPDLDSTAEKYEAVKARRTEAGKKGAEKRWQTEAVDEKTEDSKRWQTIANDSKRIETMTNASDEWQTMANMAVDVDVDVDVTSKDVCNIGRADARRRKMPPTVEEVEQYCRERMNGIDAEAFVNFYEAKGWMIGKNKMKDWRAAVRTWERSREKKRGTDALADVWRQIEAEKRGVTS